MLLGVCWSMGRIIMFSFQTKTAVMAYPIWPMWEVIIHRETLQWTVFFHELFLALSVCSLLNPQWLPKPFESSQIAPSIHLSYLNQRFRIRSFRAVGFSCRPYISKFRHSKNTAVEKQTGFSTHTVSLLNTLDWVSVQRSTEVNLTLGTFLLLFHLQVK